MKATVGTGSTYTVDAGGTLSTTTITVVGEIEVTDCGVNEAGRFFLSAINLNPGITYGLYYSSTLEESSFPSKGATAMGDGANPVTFEDPIVLDSATDPKLFYRVQELP